MRKNKVAIVIFLSVIILFLLMVLSYYFINKSAIDLNNRTEFYIQEFLETTPQSDILLKELERETAEFLQTDSYKKGFYLSEYNKEYIKECILVSGFSQNRRDMIKQQYFNKVIMMRLKVLAYQNNVDEYNELFNMYIYDIENNFYTGVSLVQYFLGDQKHPLSYDSDLFKIIESSFVNCYNNCGDVTTKFYLLNELIIFYNYFDECSVELSFYRNELKELLKANKSELESVISSNIP